MSSNDEYSYIPSSTDFQARYTGPTESELTPEQRAIRSSILASRPHTGLSGPFGPWLANPEIAQPSQQLGKVCRYDTSLSKRESELVILLTGAKYKSDTEFDIHAIEANRAGVAWDVIRSIPWRGDEKFSLEAVKRCLLPVLQKEHDNMELSGNYTKTSREREAAIVLFTAELLETSSVTDNTYEKTKAVLDGKDSVLVEITAILGYYAYVSYTLNVFRIPSGIGPVK
jgi:4-carboxymuconolactone decarboxylase